MNGKCECHTLTRAYSSDIYTNHHQNCEHYDLNGDVVRIITNLIDGINSWAKDEDGIHPECWEAYKSARAFINIPVREVESEATP